MLICHKLQYRLKNCPPSFRSIANMTEGDGSSRNFRSAYYEKLGFCGNEEKNILDLLISSSSFDFEKFSDLCDRHDLDRRYVESWKVFLGVECNRKNPFDEFANVRRVRAEHFHSLKHHLEVLLRHNLVMRERSRKCSNSDRSNQSDDSHQRSSNESECNSESQHKENNVSNVSVGMERGDAFKKDSHAMSKSGSTSSDDVFEYIEANPGRKITLMYLLEAGKLDSKDISTQLDSNYCLRLTAMASFFVNVSKDLQEAFFLFRNFTKKLEENQAETVNV